MFLVPHRRLAPSSDCCLLGLDKRALSLSPPGKAFARRLFLMENDARWWRSFHLTLSRSRKLNLGCFHCQTGTCLSDFATPDAQSKLREWHAQWAALPAEAQDAHILWVFQGSMAQKPSSEGTQTAVSDAEAPGPASPAAVISESDSETPDDQASASKRQRIDTESDASEVSLDSESSKPSATATRCTSRPRRPRRGRFSADILGHKVCVAAGLRLMRVGAPRLARVLAGRPDGRKHRPQLPGKQTASVWKFLWRVYHSVAEGMPDKFNFGSPEAQTMVLAVMGRARRAQGSLAPSAARDEDGSDDEGSNEESGEQVTRAIAAHAMHIESRRNPAENTAMGPGMFQGPLRFLPPGKRIHLYWEYVTWSRQGNMPAASFRTFLRAFGKCRHCLRFRKIGQHAVCQACTTLKARLRIARLPQERQAVLEEYTEHVLRQWCDRQVYANATSVSLECRRLLQQGVRFARMAQSVSQLCMIVDGMDQAKFRLPRILHKSKGVEKLIRPALHVQGAWAHGFGYHLAVMDADMRHDTNNNVEVISRMLEQVYVTHHGLPLGLHLQQDNTSRECKNQKILKWAVKLVALGVFRWVSLNYLVTGHSHEDIDGTFGQLAVRFSMYEFDDDVDATSLLLKLLGNLGIEETSRRASLAYKMDEAASWETWWEQMNVKFSQLTGPRAPHVFMVTRRQYLALLLEGKGPPADPAPGIPPWATDVMVAVKEYMHNNKPYQVFTAWPGNDVGHLANQPPADSVHPRRTVTLADRKAIARKAQEAHARSVISAKARDYLVQWSSSTRHRQPRPARYEFLNHRAEQPSLGGVAGPPGRASAVMRVRVQGLGVAGNARPPLPDVPESDDDAEGGALHILPP